MACLSASIYLRPTRLGGSQYGDTRPSWCSAHVCVPGVTSPRSITQDEFEFFWTATRFFFFKEKKRKKSCAIFNRLHFPGEAVAFHAHSHTQTTWHRLYLFPSFSSVRQQTKTLAHGHTVAHQRDPGCKCSGKRLETTLLHSGDLICFPSTNLACFVLHCLETTTRSPPCRTLAAQWN